MSFERDPRRDSHRRAEPILGRFSIKAILLATLAAGLGVAAISAGYYLLAVVAVVLTIAAFMAFAPPPPGSELRRTWWRWLLTLLTGAIWGAVAGLLLAAVAWFAWPERLGSWQFVCILTLCGGVLGFIFARPITGVLSTAFRWLRVFLPS